MHLIVGDEEEHQDFGWSYLREAVRERSESELVELRKLVAETLRPHELMAERALAKRKGAELSSLREPELLELGLLSEARQALVYRRTLERELVPRLDALGLWAEPRV